MFIDTHAHIYKNEFAQEYDSIVQRAQAAQVNQILMPNIDVDSMNDVLHLNKMYPKVCLPMVGLHPCSVQANYIEQLDQLKLHLTNSDIIAIGEIGIDLYWDATFEKEQINAFRQQIQWALDLNLPIVIHSRSAIEKTIAIVSEMQEGTLKGVFHCFSEGVKEAQAIMDVGFFMGIGGVATFKKSTALREIIANIPLKHLLLETDAPYLSPMPFRGKRNESSYIPYIAQVIADCQQIELEEVARQTTKNAAALFDLQN